MDFLLLEDLSALSGERLWVTGPGLPASVDRANVLPVNPICGMQGRAFRRAGVKYVVSFFFSLMDHPCSRFLFTVWTRYLNSTELSTKLETSGDDSCSLKSIVEPMAEGSEHRLHHRVAIHIGYTGRTEEQRQESILVASVLAVFVFVCVPPSHKCIRTQLLCICWHAAKHLTNSLPYTSL